MGYMNYLSTGAGFLKSTVEPKIFLRVEQIVAQQQIAFEIKPASVMLSVYKCCWNCCKCCGPGPHLTVIEPKFCHGNSHICFSPSVSKSQCQLTQIWLRNKIQNPKSVSFYSMSSKHLNGGEFGWLDSLDLPCGLIRCFPKKCQLYFSAPIFLLKKYRQNLRLGKQPMGSNGRW